VSFNLCPRGGQGENSKMFVGSTSKIISNDLQNTMNNTITSSSTYYSVDHIKSQGYLDGSKYVTMFWTRKRGLHIGCFGRKIIHPKFEHNVCTYLHLMQFQLFRCHIIATYSSSRSNFVFWIQSTIVLQKKLNYS
jgi:hypothetical protein